MLHILKNLLLLSLTVNDDSSVKYLDYITKNYFVKQSVLLIHLANSSFDLKERYIKFLSNSEIVSLELCNVEDVVDVEKDKRSHVANTIIWLNDAMIDDQQIQMLKIVVILGIAPAKWS